jgi:hypothetical protein
MPQDDDKIADIDQDITTFEAEFDAAMKDLKDKQAAALTRLNDAIGQVGQQTPAAGDEPKN